jgi:hypothetical protein
VEGEKFGSPSGTLSLARNYEKMIVMSMGKVKHYLPVPFTKVLQGLHEYQIKTIA